MKGTAFFSALLVTTLSAFAQVTPDRNTPSADSFCLSRIENPRNLQSMIVEIPNQLWFTNQGGLFGGGTCWWHSRFTRSAAYLAVFEPALPKPSAEEAKKIISRLRDRKGMTLIPGFRNLREFSLSYGNEIQQKLNDWQRSDGLLKASWVRGLSGSSEVSADKLAEKMDELYERVERGEIVYQMLQMPGVVAHAWLVTGMEKTADGYKLTVLDSNTGKDSYVYRYGMTTFDYQNWYRFVPYTGQVGEERKLLSKMTEFCTGKKPEQEEESEEN